MDSGSSTKVNDSRDGRRGFYCVGDTQNRKSLQSPLDHWLKNQPKYISLSFLSSF